MLRDATPRATNRSRHGWNQVDVDVNSDAAEKYEIEAMPTFKLIKSGSVITTITGADEASLEAALNQHK